MEDWARLYEAAIRIREIAPWRWLDERQLFGVQDPDTGEIGFVSVMGALGEHHAVAGYTGPKGLYGFIFLEQMDQTSDPGMMLEIPQLQVSFEDRTELAPEDLGVIKQLGLKFRGRHAWPMFRSFRPGYFPWFFEPDEVRGFTYVLEQTLEVVTRAQEDPGILEPEDETSYLVRVAQNTGGTLVWGDRVVSVLPPEPESVTVPMDMDALRKLQSLPTSPISLEADLSFFPGSIGEKGARPQYAYLLMLVDSSGFVLGGEVMSPTPSFGAMCGTIPMVVARMLVRHHLRPREIKIKTEALRRWFELLGDDLGFEVTLRAKLPMLDKAMGAFAGWVQRGGRGR